MKNITKNAKTILFAGLIAAMILPFGNYQMVDAKQQYTLSEINEAFAKAEGYMSYYNGKNISVDKNSMKSDNIPTKDIKIIDEWATLNNKLISALESGDAKQITAAAEFAETGKFSLLVNGQDDNSAQTRTDVNYWSLTACGITYGQTQHSNPTVTLNLAGYSSKSSIETALENSGYHEIPYPYTDYGSVGDDYGKANYTGQGDCNEGEFRDQNFIYPPNTHGQSNWHTLQQLNEPNPELNTYDMPTYWWAVYTYFWHLAN